MDKVKDDKVKDDKVKDYKVKLLVCAENVEQELALHGVVDELLTSDVAVTIAILEVGGGGGGRGMVWGLWRGAINTRWSKTYQGL